MSSRSARSFEEAFVTDRWCSEMTLSAFSAALRKVWLPALIVLAAAIAGSFVYVQKRVPPSAKASVAVRDPLTINPVQNPDAAVSFDSVVKSDRLADLVGKQLNLPASAIRSALSVEVVLPSSGINISPLYVIHAQDADLQRAKDIVNAAVTQSTKLYTELNSADVQEATATLQPQLDAANAALTNAQKAYDDHLAAGGSDHTAQINALNTTISSLTAEVAQAKADAASAARLDPRTAAVASGRVDDLNDQLATTVTQLTDLQKQQATFQSLSDALSQARTTVSNLNALKQQVVNQAPLTDQVKVLDNAASESKTVMKILVYALGIIVGLLLAFTVIYLEAVRQRGRFTTEEVLDVLGVPALGRIPRRAVAREGK
jgi:capsular polysaccharide biosynthesis protein